MTRQFLSTLPVTTDMKSVSRAGSFNQFLKNNTSSKFMEAARINSIFSNDSTDSSSSSDHCNRLRLIQTFIPKLTSSLHKGQCGRIGVIGGSFDFTGAPYFSAISSLKLGADLVHVFCSQSAGPVIKSYSPELMVHPLLDGSNVVKNIEPWLEKLHALVIGPGMGRSKDMLKNVGDIITFCKMKLNYPLPLVIDADGLYLITENLTLIEGYRGPIILTPNSIEFSRLSVKMSENDPLKIAASLNVIILLKGVTDVLANGIFQKLFQSLPQDMYITCDVPGSNRRCGGQGDILSGCIATFVAWASLHLKPSGFLDFNDLKDRSDEWLMETLMLYIVSAYGGSVITRTCSRLAFELNGRGMTATDMISCIPKAFRLHFGV